MGRRKRTEDKNDNGFAEWGGYMDAKKAKLINQFAEDVDNNRGDVCKIFNGIAIFVNGFTIPSSDELKQLMIKFGGIYHHYYDSKKTTHVIASNLPNCKIQKVKDTKVIKPDWITESISAKRLLDYRPYMLYTNQSRTQPKLAFSRTNDNSCSYDTAVKYESFDWSLNDCTDNHQQIGIVEVPTENINIDSSINAVVETEIFQCEESKKFMEYADLKANTSKKELICNLSLEHGNNSKSMDFDKKVTFCVINNDEKPGTSDNKKYMSAKNQFSRMTASEENFLSEFYSNSRLHHISTMSATFKQYVKQLRDRNCENNFPGRRMIKKWLNERKSLSNIHNNDIYTVHDEYFDVGDGDELLNDVERIKSNTEVLNKSSEKIIMHIDMDCFFVSVGIRNRPDLKGKPVAVTHAKAKINSDHCLRKESNFKTEIELYKNRVESKLKNKVPGNKLDQKSAVMADGGSEKNSTSKPVTRYDWANNIGELDSMSEIASCSYEARKAGVKNGMFLGQALKLCPDLMTIPYDFDDYKTVSSMLYDTLAEFTVDIEAVSCDEMFVDCTSLLEDISCTPLEFASFLRKQLKEKTGCPCSIGFGGNRLQARLATKKAKPDGQYFLQLNDVTQFIKNINVSDLPGVGKTISYKLSSMGIKTCEDLQMYSLSELKTEFGIKTGQALYDHCRGIDNRGLTFSHVRKSVSAEVNYGIRFKNQEEAEKFLYQMASEVKNRLQEIQMKTRCITLKLMVRAKEAPEETAKFLGHGYCHNFSKSSTLTIPISDVSIIYREVLSMYRKLQVTPKDLRGVGVQLSRLVPENSGKKSNAVLDKFLKLKNNSSKVPNKNIKINHIGATKINNISEIKPSKNDWSALKSMAKVDESVFAELPKDIQEEIVKTFDLGHYNISSHCVSSSTHEESITDPKINQLKTKKNYLCLDDNQKPKEKALSVSQIDQSFIQALPIHLQEEAYNDLYNNQSQRRRTIHFSCSANITDEPVLCSFNDHKSNIYKDVFSDDKINDMSVAQVSNLVWNWVTEESYPLLQDVKVMFSLLVKYVYQHQLDELNVVVNTLFRSVKKATDNKNWKEIYSTIMKGIQEAMIIEYGGELKMENSFD